MLFNPTVLSAMQFLQRVFSPVMLFLLVGCGLVLVAVDNRRLGLLGLTSEANVARISGWLYLMGGPFTYLWIRIYFYFAP